MELKKQIFSVLGLNSEEITLGFQAKTEDGTIVVSTAEELAVGVDMSVLTEDGTTIKLPVGTYKLEDGTTVVIEEEGIVAEFMPGEPQEEEVAEEELSEDLAKEDDDYEEEEKKMNDYDFEEIEKRMSKLEEEIEKMKATFGEGKEEEMSEDTVEEVTEPSKNPRVKTTKTTEVVEFSSDEFVKLKEENEKLKAELDKKPASAPLSTNKFSSNDNAKTSQIDLSKLSKRERILYNITNNN